MKTMWLYEEDQVMDGCRTLAWDLYGKGTTLSHERVAFELACFIYERISEQPATAEAAALISIVRSAERIATYFSCGAGPIRQSLAILIRLALPYEDHPDYRHEWRPTA